MPTSTVHHTLAYVGLGSNQGAADEPLRTAMAALKALSGVSVAACSPVYCTEPQDEPNQNWFYNQVAQLVCQPFISPEILLAAMQAIEHCMGRRRDPNARYGPRIIDLDLLLFGTQLRHGPELVLPHPRMTERAFVLVPLHDLAPGLTLPDGRSVDQLLQAICYRVDGNQIFQ